MSVRKYCIWLMARSYGFSLHFLWVLQGLDWRLVSLMCSWPSDCPALHSLICGPGRPPHRLPESLDSWYTPQQLHHNILDIHPPQQSQQLHHNILDIHHSILKKLYKDWKFFSSNLLLLTTMNLYSSPFTHRLSDRKVSDMYSKCTEEVLFDWIIAVIC